MRRLLLVLLLVSTVAIAMHSSAQAVAIRFDCTVGGQVVNSINVNFHSAKSQAAFQNFLAECDAMYGPDAQITAAVASSNAADEMPGALMTIKLRVCCGSCHGQSNTCPDTVAEFQMPFDSTKAIDAFIAFMQECSQNPFKGPDCHMTVEVVHL